MVSILFGIIIMGRGRRVSEQMTIAIKGPSSQSTYGDQELGEGLSFPACIFAGKYHREENDCNCNHPETGDIFFCATHHIPGQPPCPLDLKRNYK
jgi:hypothetical protein